MIRRELTDGLMRLLHTVSSLCHFGRTITTDRQMLYRALYGWTAVKQMPTHDSAARTYASVASCKVSLYIQGGAE